MKTAIHTPDEAFLLLECLEQPARINGSSRPVLTSCHSEKGCRDTNQDMVWAERHKTQHLDSVELTVLADGMGGHQGGEAASSLAGLGFLAKFISCIVSAAQQPDGWGMVEWIREAFRVANTWVTQYAQYYPEYADMGTTLTLAVKAGNTLYVASVGDSRAYRWRNGTLTLLTHDDSLVQELVDQGQLTPEAAECHPHSNVITRALGSEDALDSLDIQSSGLLPGDIVIVVCDGVWRGGGADMEEMCRHLEDQPFTPASLDAAAKSLVDKALLRGSDDNVTCGLLWAAPEESKHSMAVPNAGNGPAADQEEEDKSWHTEIAPNATQPMEKAPSSARLVATT